MQTLYLLYAALLEVVNALSVNHFITHINESMLGSVFTYQDPTNPLFKICLKN